MEDNRIVIQNDQNIPAYEAGKSAKHDHRKTSIVYTVLSILLYIVALVPIIVVPTVLAVRCYELVPYYTFLPFIGVIIGGVFALIFTVVALVVSRKNTKSNVRSQTVKLAITYVCLTGLFAIILTYAVPDVIEYATQNTLFCEDLYYNGASQAEYNASLDRDFFIYNLLNGNMNTYDENGAIAEKGDYSYKTLAKRVEDENGGLLYFENADIEASYNTYMQTYTTLKDIQDYVLDPMAKKNKRKYELYEFIYNNYVLNDYDYAFLNNVNRRAFALAVIDYIYTNFDYEGMLKEGFNNPRMKQLFVNNYENFKQDGYNSFDDPLLLYAQQNGRMTIPVVVRLILNGGWKYNQSVVTGDGEVTYTEEGNYLYQLYDPEMRDKFIEDGGTFDFEGEIVGNDGKPMKAMYGFNKEGYMIFENGVTKRPMEWLVLDMLGDPMALTAVDLSTVLGGALDSILTPVIQMFPNLIDSLGNLVQDELINEVLVVATGGAKLSIGLCIDDQGALAINLFPMNHVYGMLGYMQATWMESNGLLFAVINVAGLRNWFSIFSAVGIVLVIAAGVLRECGRKTRERTEDSRDRIERAKRKGATADGEEDKAEGGETPVDADAPTEPKPAVV